jgi:hypothetical protein
MTFCAVGAGLMHNAASCCRRLSAPLRARHAS